ncbi:MAG TPA: SGNH/GDSL hydrolase family protein [Phycisphaerae bacterium]|nr:SGNH/GDSL hydrolase family protein [Phycisphaerae bacterium]
MRAFWSAAVLCLGLARIGVAAESDFFLKDGETVVFYGDSITAAGLYVDYVEAYLLTAFPDKQFHVVNRGISSETIAGTSEPDHQPRRPNALDRFTRDIASTRPDVIVACFGMNDGNYAPFDPQRFRKFQNGLKLLKQRTRDQTTARLVVMTPPSYDPYRRQVVDPDALAYGYKFPVIDYDDVLGRYAEWLMSLREDGLTVVDLHTAMNRHLQRRREKKVSFSLQPDGIHPDATGHWLMAQTLLEAWNAPAVSCEARIDAADLKAVAGDVTNLRRDGQGIAFTWRMPPPMPMDPAWDAESIAIEKVRERFNRFRLTVTGLTAARYRLSADEPDAVEVDRAELERGLDPLGCAAFSAGRRGGAILALVRKHQQASRAAWQKDIATTAPSSAKGRRPARGEDERAAAVLDEALRRECRPRDVEVRLEPIP